MKLGYAMLLVAVGAMLVIAPAALAAEKGDKGHAPKGNAVFGEVKAVSATSITVAAKKKDAPAEEKTIAVNADTKILIAVKAEGEKKAEPKAGTITDVQVGMRVAVTLNEKGDAAAKIMVMPAGSERGGKHEKK